jgi:hypothetical protein
MDLGTNTFLVFPMILGIVKRVQGVYENIPNGYPSNIFTAFRGLISDYGMFLSVFLQLILSMVGNLIENQLLISRRPRILLQTVLAGCYFLILYGYIISPYIYFSYLAAFFVFFGYVYILYYGRYNHFSISNK